MRVDSTTPEQLRDRELLLGVPADRDVDLPERTGARRSDDEDYMADWCPSRALRAVGCGVVDLPERVIADASEIVDPGAERGFVSGVYEVITLEDRVYGNHVAAVLVRRLDGGAPVGWRFLGRAHDSRYVLLDATADRSALVSPEEREELSPDEPPHGAAVAERTSDGKAAVWIVNPTGNGIEAFAAVDPEGRIVAVVLQLH